MKKNLGFLLFILSSLFMVTACGSDKLNVTLHTPKSFTVGQAIPIQISLSKENGEAVTGAKVKAEIEMKGMDHGRTEVVAEDTGDGRYLRTVKMPMDGDWIAQINVNDHGTQSEYTKEFHLDVKNVQTAHKSTKNIQLPAFSLIDQDGKRVTEKDLLGNRVVMTFTYVKCNDPNACPILLSNLKTLQNDLKEKGVNKDHIKLVSVSIDPDNDTPDVMKKHAEEMNFDMSNFSMLTGNSQEIKALAETLGVQFQKEKDSQVVEHENKTLLFNETGKLTDEFTLSTIDHDELFELVTMKK